MRSLPKARFFAGIALLITVLFICVLLSGCGGEAQASLSSSESSSSSSSKSSSSSESSSESEPEVIPFEVDETITERLTTASGANEDTVAWLQIPGTSVDYAVMQGEDNDFYWSHDNEGNALAYGSVYAHHNNDLTSVDTLYRNTVLFGHNKYIPSQTQDDGTPYDEHFNFSTLMFFQGQKWTNAHRYATLTIGDKTTYWVFFAALDTETVNDKETFYYWNTYEQTDEEWQGILDQAKDRSYWDYDIDVTLDDRVLMLSTCSYDWGMTSGLTNAKYVVMARQLRADEMEKGQAFFDELPAVKVNEDRREPTGFAVGSDGNMRRFYSVESGQYKASEYKPDME